MPEILHPSAPLYPWLLERHHRNLRVIRNPEDPLSLQLDDQEVEIGSYRPAPESGIDILLVRRDGPPDDRWVSWRQSADYRVDLRHFPTRAIVLGALADVGHPRPWALGSCWSSLTDEQAARATAGILLAVGPDPAKPANVVPVAVLGRWTPHHCVNVVGMAFEGRVRGKGRSVGWEWRVGSPPTVHSGPEVGDVGRAVAYKHAQTLGALLWDQITPSEKPHA